MHIHQDSFFTHASSAQEGLSSEADSGAQHRRLAALQEWLVERMGRGPPRIAHLPDHLLFSFLPAAFTLFVQPGSNPATDLTAQQCQVRSLSSRCHALAWFTIWSRYSTRTRTQTKSALPGRGRGQGP